MPRSQVVCVVPVRTDPGNYTVRVGAHGQRSSKVSIDGGPGRVRVMGYGEKASSSEDEVVKRSVQLDSEGKECDAHLGESWLGCETGNDICELADGTGRERSAASKALLDRCDLDLKRCFSCCHTLCLDVANSSMVGDEATESCHVSSVVSHLRILGPKANRKCEIICLQHCGYMRRSCTVDTGVCLNQRSWK